MQAPLAGSVLLDGSDLHRMSKRDLARRVSVVLTSKVGLGQLTAWDLASLGRMPFTNWSGRLTPNDEEIVERALRDAGALAMSNRLVAELSDGERQKVLLARALAQQPKLMILDEITAFLDLPRRIEVMRILRDLVQSGDRAILLSTHDLELALSMAATIWLLSKDGPLTAGAPEDLVLNGALAKAFAAEGIDFNADTGGFIAAKPTGRMVQLSGNGPAVVWTRRALEREGWTPVKAAAPSDPHVAVEQHNAAVEWRLQAAERVEIHHTVASLLASPLLSTNGNEARFSKTQRS
jgi:iron complex transport system ATP-binding protein